jgi:cytoskeleton protein RodZ
MDPFNHNNAGRETQEEVSLGRLLKRTREDRQIELDEAFRVTRIRRHTLEALENERWDELPSQVFVKGFLKTYAEFLGLSKETVLELYERISPPEGDKSELLKQVRPRRKRWPLTVILSLLALVLIASIVYLKRADVSLVDKAFQDLRTQAPIGEDKETAVREERGDRVEPDEEEALSKSVREREGEREALAKPESVEETDLTEIAPVDQQEAEKPPSPRFLLTANVRSRTWIAIFVDDQPVKEYLFQPGETITWTAQKGFDILVGNAGGIDFSLNGKEIGTLGAEGKVVRVKLPKGEQ